MTKRSGSGFMRKPAWLALALLVGLVYFPAVRTQTTNSPRMPHPAADKPLVNLGGSQTPTFAFTGSAGAVAALRSGTANPTAVAAADFDADGALDVVAGYATSSGGVLVIYRGNPDAYAPKDVSLYGKAMLGNVPATFLPTARAFAVPEFPELIVTGDFNRDGHRDVAEASRGGALYLMSGDGRGNLQAPRAVALPGVVTALAASADGHIAAGIDGPSGPRLVILAPGDGGPAAVATHPLPARADTIAWGNLGAGADVVVGAGGHLAMVYDALGANTQIETFAVPYRAMALTAGDFIWDRDARTEIAVLAEDGSIHILQHGTLDRRPLTAADIPGRRAALRENRAQRQNPVALGRWSEARQVPYRGFAPTAVLSPSAFGSPRLAASPTHDLMVLDAAGRELTLLDTSGATVSPSAAMPFSTAPLAAFAMPQKIDASRDIVVFTAGRTGPTLVSIRAGLTFNVLTTADEDDAGSCPQDSTVISGPGPDGALSLREAVCEANNNGASTSTILIPAGTYDLAVSTFGGGASASSSGELQVGMQSGNVISLVGAGQNKTIIQQVDDRDRVIETDEELNGNIPVSISNLTLASGNCNASSGLDCAGFGGGAVLAGGIGGDDLTVTNVTMDFNATSSTDQDSGGAIAYYGPTLTIANANFSNNTAGGTGGAVYAADSEVGGGGYLSGSISITGSAFTGNSAAIDGGAAYFDLEAGYPAVIAGSTFGGSGNGNTVTGTTGSGGAIYVTQETQATPASFTLKSSRIVGNSAAGGGSGLYSVFATDTVTDNWWGCNAGPGNTGCSSIGTSGSTATFNPWLVLGITADPTQIAAGGSSTLTADLAHDSSGATGSSVPNGTPVTFEGTLGFASPSSITFTSGQATSTFFATGTCVGSGTATVDNQTVSAAIDIGQPPAITSANNSTFTAGTSGSFGVTTTGSPAPSLAESGALPSGVTFVDNGNGTATLSGTPTAGGVFSLGITAQSCLPPNAVQSFTLTVDQAPAITSAGNTKFIEDTAGSFTVTSTGYPVATLTESGALPSGVTFVPNGNGTGTLSGTPTARGLFPISFTANNGVGTPAVQSFSLIVNHASFTALPNALGFGNQSVDAASAAQSVTVTNTGNLALPITSITRSGADAGQFTETNGCGHTVKIGQTCTISVVFKPSKPGAKTATLSVDAGEGAGTQTVTLSGTGIAGPYTVSPTALAFGDCTVGTSCAAPSQITVTNNGSVALPVSSIKSAGANAAQFTETDDCRPSIAAGSACTISVSFTPTKAGAKSATLDINAGEGAGTQTVGLSGTGS